MKRLVIFSLLLTLAGWSEGLSGLEYAADTVGGKWVSSSGAVIYVGAASHEGKIDITINGGRPIKGYIGQEPDGSIFFTYTSPDGTTMKGRIQLRRQGDRCEEPRQRLYVNVASA